MKKGIKKACALAVLAPMLLAAPGWVAASCAYPTEDLLVEVLGELLRETLKKSRDKSPEKGETSAKRDTRDGRGAGGSASEVHWRVYQKIDELGTSLSKLGDKVAASNKPGFEAAPGDGGMAEEGMIDPAKSLAWAKDKTIVTGHVASGDAKRRVDLVSTADPLQSFAGGIHVGSRKKELEAFLGAPLDEISSQPGLVNLSPDPQRRVRILYDDRKVTRLDWLRTDVAHPDEVYDFMEKKMKEMKFPELPPSR